jgi:exopolyphosphatase/guanosine-5'-triphosphate,3'-diphosphate pyrophosphatase
MDQFTATENPIALTSASRRAVVDLGSNSVRLVIYEGEARNPVQIFNEKAVLRLAKGMTKTGQLDACAMER